MRNTAVLLGPLSALAMGLTLCGCTTISDCKYECDQKLRSHQAWCAFDACHDECFTGDYRSGWKAGYYDVATGGNGCPPVVPPKRYWRPPVCFEHDPCRRNEWYCGWQDGAACAQSEPDFHHLQPWMQCGPACCQTALISHAPGHGDVMPEVPGESQLPADQFPPETAPLDMPDPMAAPGTDAAPAAPGTDPAAPGMPPYDSDPMPMPDSAAPAEAEPMPDTTPAQPNVQRRLPADFISVQRLVENARRQAALPGPQAAVAVPSSSPRLRPATNGTEQPEMLRLLVRNATVNHE